MSQSDGDGRHDELRQELVVLYVQDEINQALTGHGASHYESPPQPRQHALTLARVLLGYTDAELNGDAQWSCPIAGGRRTVALKPAAQAAPEGYLAEIGEDLGSGYGDREDRWRGPSRKGRPCPGVPFQSAADTAFAWIRS